MGNENVKTLGHLTLRAAAAGPEQHCATLFLIREDKVKT